MDRQDQIINFLSSASAYADIEGADGLDVQRRETHISVVFLVGQSAFKMKRAVAYPYLDFSTLDRRRELCEREITINSRTAPDIYRGVIAVTCNAKGEFALDGDGDPVEWLVSMHRFDDATLWDRQALAGDLDRHDFEVLADQVARFHAKAETCDGDAAVSALAATIDGNRQSMASHTGDLFDFEMVEALFSRTRKAYELAKPVLQTRANEGCVRICHGDLHLGNIFTGAIGPVLFDAIEFNEAFSHIDILYDLAFLLMDVDYRVGKRPATVLMNRYLDHSGNPTGVCVVPFLMSVRAAIRAHVSASAAAKHADPAAAEQLRRHACQYLAVASDCLRDVTPRLIAVGGLSGSGKSRMARVVASALDTVPGARVVRSDTVRKRLAGVPFDERLPADSYTPAASAQIYAACLDEARQILKSGYPVVLDAVFAKSAERSSAETLAAGTGVPFDGLWLEAPMSVMRERVEERRHNASDANAAVIEVQSGYDLGNIQWTRVDSSGKKEQTESLAFACLGLERGVE